MNIKLVKNLEEGGCISVNGQFLLQITDDNRQLERFTGKRYFIFNPDTNERFEVLPEIPKFFMAGIRYSYTDNPYIIFTSAKQINEKEVEITFYRYHVYTGDSEKIYGLVAALSKLEHTMFIKVNALTPDYCLFETISQEDGQEQFKIILKELKNNKEIQVENPLFLKCGIDKIIPLTGNICGIKAGQELIGIINVNQFVSDLALGLENVYIDVLDEGGGTVSFPYMEKYRGSLLYLRRELESGNEEVILYDYENKVKKIRFHHNLSDNRNLNRVHVIHGAPYYFVEEDGYTTIVNLNTQKEEAQISGDYAVKYVMDDIIVTGRHMGKRFLIGREKDFVEVFKFPDMSHPVYKVNGAYGGCIEHMEDLLIFIK